jgi:hypothetical protein
MHATVDQSDTGFQVTCKLMCIEEEVHLMTVANVSGPAEGERQ